MVTFIFLWLNVIKSIDTVDWSMLDGALGR